MKQSAGDLERRLLNSIQTSKDKTKFVRGIRKVNESNASKRI